MFESGGACLFHELFLGKDLVQIDLECGSYFRLDKDAPEWGYCLQKAIVPAIFAFHAEHAEVLFCVVTAEIMDSSRGENLLYNSPGVRFREHVHIEVFQPC